MDLDDISPHLRLRISTRARRMTLRLNVQARVVELVVPRRASMARALDFARRHRGWVEARIAALPAIIGFIDGAVLPIHGQDVTVTVIHDPNAKRTGIVRADNILRVTTNKPDPSARIARYLKSIALDALADASRQKADAAGVKLLNVRIRDTKSRWGSCSTDGNLSYSWRLIFAPPAAFDYVVAHEVAHLRHMNHGPEFWALCESLSDNFQNGHKWMRRHGQELMRFGASGTP